MVRGTQRAGSTAKFVDECVGFMARHGSPARVALLLQAARGRHAQLQARGVDDLRQVPSRPRFRLSASTMSWSGGGAPVASTTVPARMPPASPPGAARQKSMP